MQGAMNREKSRRQSLRGDPVPSRPLVYYVFGKRKYEDTWVLTEDDFFDYVIRMSSYDLMPLEVSQALTAGSLLFLGFPLSDWKFRILLRMILAKGGSANLGDFNHVGVQIDPEEHTFADAVRAKTYLQKYFSKSSIDIYWGSSADFLRDLKKQLQAYDAEDPQACNGKRGIVVTETLNPFVGPRPLGSGDSIFRAGPGDLRTSQSAQFRAHCRSPFAIGGREEFACIGGPDPTIEDAFRCVVPDPHQSQAAAGIESRKSVYLGALPLGLNRKSRKNCAVRWSRSRIAAFRIT